ncbi:hypothetical protein [Burkholderia anthina]|uniref:hypothetical protein n=1 Tax=Burkholderia anthina TaxID=179879 RepID=UPI003133379C
MHLRQAGIGCRFIGRDRNDSLRRIGIGIGINLAHDIVAERIALPERRRRFIHCRAGSGLLHRAIRVATRRTAGRAEPVQRRLPPGIVAGHCVNLGNGFITHHGRCTRNRLEHRVAKQVERAFVARRIAGRRIARPRGGARRGIAGSRG